MYQVPAPVKALWKCQTKDDVVRVRSVRVWNECLRGTDGGCGLPGLVWSGRGRVNPGQRMNVDLRDHMPRYAWETGPADKRRGWPIRMAQASGTEKGWG